MRTIEAAFLIRDDQSRTATVATRALPLQQRSRSRVGLHLKCIYPLIFPSLTKDPSRLRRRNLKTEFLLWKRIKCFLSTLPRRNLKTEVSLWERIKCFPSPLPQRNWKRRFHSETHPMFFRPHYAEGKTQQSPVVLDLCLRKTGSGKSHHYRDVISYKNLRFQNIFRPHYKTTKSRRFQIPWVSKLPLAPFSRQISVNRKNKAVFSIGA